MKKILLFFIAMAVCQLGFTKDDPLLMLNFREIYHSYASIMDVDAKDADLKIIYERTKANLPTLGLTTELSSPMVLAMTELGGAFCGKAVEQERAKEFGERHLFKYIDFEHGPVQFQDFLKRRMTNHLAELFWKRPATEMEIQLISQHIDRLGETAPQATEETPKVLHVLCTTFATSLGFVIK